MAYKPDRFPCEKLFLIIFNFLAWLLSLAFLAIAAWAWYIKGYYDELIKGILETSSIILDPVLLIAGLGILVFIISFVGCVGSLRENICLLKFFSAIVTTLILFQVIAGILVILYPDWFLVKFNDFIEQTIRSYRDDADLQNIIDFTQKEFECCGGRQPDDWDENKYFKCDNIILVNSVEYTSVEACGVPYSCCKLTEPEKLKYYTNQTESNTFVVNTQCGYGVRKKTQLSEKIHQEGCILKFEAWLNRELYYLITAVAIIFALQIIPLFLANTSIQTIHDVIQYNKSVERQNERRLEREYTRQVRALRQYENNKLFESTLGYFTIRRNRNPPAYNPEFENTDLNPPRPVPRQRTPRSGSNNSRNSSRSRR